MTILQEIASVLKTTEKNVLTRIAGMKLGPVCSRCGGTGNYSFNQIDGSRCYGCNGSGYMAPAKNDLPGILEAAKEAVENGEFDRYLQKLRDRKFCKRVGAEIFAVWKATSVAHANRQCSHMIRGSDVEGLEEVRKANAAMANAQSRWAKIEGDLKMDPTEKAAIAIAVIDEIKNADFDVPDSTIENIKQAMADKIWLK